MPTVHRQDGFQFRIFTADHPPAHVHAYKGGHVVKIGLADAGVLGRSEMPARDQVRAVRIVDQHRKALLTSWREIHG